VEINGRELVDPITEYQHDSNYYHLQIRATLTESSTEIKVKQDAQSPNMVEKSKTMSFINVPQKFKPGFPVSFKVATAQSRFVKGRIMLSTILNTLEKLSIKYGCEGQH
jgi:hypothetical protein